MMSKIFNNSDSGGYGCGRERFFGGEMAVDAGTGRTGVT
jgi:hypothetical protein